MSREPQTVHVYPAVGLAPTEDRGEKPARLLRAIAWWLARLLLAALAIVVAFEARSHAAAVLAPYTDEPLSYVPAAIIYEQGLSTGNWSIITNAAGNPEHPLLAKLIFAGAIWENLGQDGLAGKKITVPQAIPAARQPSVLAGTGEVAALALIDPLAALFLAVQRNAITFSGLAMLDAIAAFFSTLAVAAMVRANGQNNTWYWAAAVALGCALASKYTSAIVLIVLLPYVAARRWRTAISMVGWCLLAGGVFFLTDPYLWIDPVHRLLSSGFYHVTYVDSWNVVGRHYPWYQQVVWIFQGPPNQVNVGVIPWQWPVLTLGILGIPFLWRKGKLYVVWLAVALLSLFSYHVEWPQYTLVILAPLSLSAAACLEGIARWTWRMLTGGQRDNPANTVSRAYSP